MEDDLRPESDQPKRVHVGRVTKQCENCGKDVTRKNSQFREHVFCSKACYNGSDYSRDRIIRSNARRYVGRREARPCLNCGALVSRAVSQFKARTFCSKACRAQFDTANPVRQVTQGGYIKIFVGRDYPNATGHGHILEHRKVMQDYLGRALVKDENVHHRNGDRQDNRIENLELWSRSQPSGQRVADKLAWAREFIALYEGHDMS